MSAPDQREGPTADDMRVIYERHHGWEKAAYAQLALIFGLDRAVIGRICRDHSNAARA